MNTQETVDQLKQLKLKGMMQAYESLITLPAHEQLSLHHAVARLTEAELQHRSHQKTQMYLKLSKLRYNAVLENVKCSENRNFTKEQLLHFADGSFIERAENTVITGATGCGKSYLACALGRLACTLGYKVLYLGMTRFLEKINQSKLEGNYVKLLNQIEKNQLIILDDFGLHPLDNTTRLALLQILEDRYAKKSVIITSQLPIKSWFEYINEPTLADAIMDRLSANANKIELRGESLRKEKLKNKV
jgi:DNA replication protein DnaC